MRIKIPLSRGAISVVCYHLEVDVKKNWENNVLLLSSHSTSVCEKFGPVLRLDLCMPHIIRWFVGHRYWLKSQWFVLSCPIILDKIYVRYCVMIPPVQAPALHPRILLFKCSRYCSKIAIVQIYLSSSSSSLLISSAYDFISFQCTSWSKKCILNIFILHSFFFSNTSYYWVKSVLHVAICNLIYSLC